MSKFFTKVAGSSHYQKAIGKCIKGLTCELVPEPDNPHSDHAIKVMRGKHHIGYISKSMSKSLLRQINNNDKIMVVIKDITGGTKTKPTKGVNLQISINEKSGCLSVILLVCSAYVMLMS